MKKTLTILLCIVIIAASFTLFTSCKDEEPVEKPLMVFLGDSIAEAILGPSPASERETYGYYSVIGKINDYTFINRAVSGDQADDMLEYIKLPDDGAKMTQTYLKDADIIEVSILGNDFLNMNMTNPMLEAAQGDFSRQENTVAKVTGFYEDIIKTLREYNPDAVILMQTCYNPVFASTPLLPDKAKAQLKELGYETDEQYRALGDKLLGYLNGIIYDYLEEHPGAYEIVDVFSAFDKIIKEDKERGRRLIFNDGVHPTDEGHAVIAECTQKKLVELGLADAEKALKEYKAHRIAGLERMYATTVNVKDVSDKINAAADMSEVTKLYFDAVKGIIPVYD